MVRTEVVTENNRVGADAACRGVLVAVALAVTLDEARLAARLEVTGIPVGTDTLTIEREVPSGNVAGVRGASDRNVAGFSSLIVRDYELPFNLDLVYTVTVYDGTTAVGTDSESFRIDYVDCDPWLVDLAQPTNSLPVLVESMSELAYGAAVGVHRVLNRRAPVLTALPAWTPSSELVVLTDTLTQRDQLRALFGSGYPFLLRSDPAARDREHVPRRCLGIRRGAVACARHALRAALPGRLRPGRAARPLPSTCRWRRRPTSSSRRPMPPMPP